MSLFKNTNHGRALVKRLMITRLSRTFLLYFLLGCQTYPLFYCLSLHFTSRIYMHTLPERNIIIYDPQFSLIQSSSYNMLSLMYSIIAFTLNETMLWRATAPQLIINMLLNIFFLCTARQDWLLGTEICTAIKKYIALCVNKLLFSGTKSKYDLDQLFLLFRSFCFVFVCFFLAKSAYFIISNNRLCFVFIREQSSFLLTLT